MVETLILLGCLYLSIRVTDYIEKQEAAREHAKYILDSVQYFIQNANRG